MYRPATSEENAVEVLPPDPVLMRESEDRAVESALSEGRIPAGYGVARYVPERDDEGRR